MKGSVSQIVTTPRGNCKQIADSHNTRGSDDDEENQNSMSLFVHSCQDIQRMFHPGTKPLPFEMTTQRVHSACEDAGQIYGRCTVEQYLERVITMAWSVEGEGLRRFWSQEEIGLLYKLDAHMFGVSRRIEMKGTRPSLHLALRYL